MTICIWNEEYNDTLSGKKMGLVSSFLSKIIFVLFESQTDIDLPSAGSFPKGCSGWTGPKAEASALTAPAT